ncbi:MAG: DUF4136 domain-containing protein [Bacteroidia bacterium]
MKKFSLIIITAIAALYLEDCRVYNFVNVNSKSAVSFNSYSSYAWLPDFTDTCATLYNNRVIRDNIRNYFAKSFSDLGYSFHPDSPDVLLQVVIFNRKVTKKVTFFPSNSKYFIGSEYYKPDSDKEYYSGKELYCYPIGYCTEKIEYVKGAVSLNVIDRKKNELVWSCTAEGNIYDPELNDKDIHPAIEAIMKKYPVKRKR